MSNVAARWTAALVAFANQDFEKAELLATEVLNHEPAHLDAADLLCLLHLKRGRPDTALAYNRIANTLQPTLQRQQQQIEILAALALQYAERGERFALLDAYAGLLRLNAENEAGALFDFLKEQYRSDTDIATGVAQLLRKHGKTTQAGEWEALGELPTKRFLLVLPAHELDEASVQRFAKSVVQNLGDHPIVCVKRGEGADYLPVLAHCFAATVFIDGPGEYAEGDTLAQNGADVYRFDLADDGFAIRMMPVGREPRATDYPHVHSHIFNRVTTALHNHYYFFPYGYLYRYLGVGPINAFGHRITADLEALKQRDAKHKLIVCFGGSSCFSMYCLHDEMFPSRLEAKLTEHAPGLRYTVLNFGQHGNVLLNHMLTWILFVQGLKPDVVISHDGFNDLAYGQISDNMLVGEHQIVYQDNLEEWGAMLNGKKEDLPADTIIDGVRQTQNFPPAVVGAYLSRLSQFAQLCTSAGSRFVWGLQPWLMSKARHSPAEVGYARSSMETRNRFIECYRNMGHLYDVVVERSAEVPAAAFVNLHEKFLGLDSDATHFFDIVHLSPTGDEVIATHYAETLKALFAGESA